MANIKISALAALTAPSTDDLLYLVDDPAGTPISKKITVANFLANAPATTFANAMTFAAAVTLTLASGNSLVVDTDTLVVDATNGRVGIGTTDPGTKLQIKGASDGTAISLLESNSTIAIEMGVWQGRGFIQGYDRTNDLAKPYYLAGQNIAFVTGTGSGGTALQPTTNTRMAIDTNGNVGIGTTEPNYLASLGAANGQQFGFHYATELTTIAAAATTDTTITIPADAVVFAASVRVTTVIPTAATFDVGVAGATTRYVSGISTAANTTSDGTLDGPRYYSAATAIRITPNLTPADNTGRVRVTIWYYDSTPPTS